MEICCACVDACTPVSIDSKASGGRALLDVGESLLRERSFVQQVLGVVTVALWISVPQACDWYFSNSVSDRSVPKIAYDREQQGDVEFACWGQC